MKHKHDAEPLKLEELQKMCEEDPRSVKIAKKSALDKAAVDFGLMTEADIKNFVVDGLENPTFFKHSESDLHKGTIITEYKFTSGRKNGYLAFHRSVANRMHIQIKSLHKDDYNQSLGTLGDILKNALLGGKNG